MRVDVYDENGVLQASRKAEAVESADALLRFKLTKPLRAHAGETLMIAIDLAALRSPE